MMRSWDVRAGIFSVLSLRLPSARASVPEEGMSCKIVCGLGTKYRSPTREFEFYKEMSSKTQQTFMNDEDERFATLACALWRGVNRLEEEHAPQRKTGGQVASSPASDIFL